MTSHLDMQGGIPPMLGDGACRNLLASITKEEMRRGIMSMKSFKALGLDGFHAFFL